MKQLRWWIRFAELEPFRFDKELRADYRSAQIAQTIANANRGKKQRPFKLSDFLLKFDSEKAREQKSWQQMQSIARKLVMIYNAEGVTG